MKCTISVLAIVVTTFFLGCRESDVAGPNGANSTQANSLLKAFPNTNEIVLQGLLQGPIAQYQVEGVVKYSLTPAPVLNRVLVDVVHSVEAKIWQLDLPANRWAVSHTSLERVDLTNKVSVPVDRRYFLQGGPNSPTLHLRFDAMITNVGLALIEIE